MNWMKALSLLPIVAYRLPQILADGKITAKEAAGLIVDIAGALGLPTDIDVSEFTGNLPARGATPPANPDVPAE